MAENRREQKCGAGCEGGEQRTEEKTLPERAEQVLEEEVRPSLLAHGGNLQLLSIEDGIARIRYTGACSGCPSADLTTEMLVREKLTAALPAVQDVVLDQAVSEELLDFARSLMKKR